MSTADSIRRWYTTGAWTAAKVQAAVGKGWITQAEADAILAADVAQPEADQ